MNCEKCDTKLYSTGECDSKKYCTKCEEFFGTCENRCLSCDGKLSVSTNKQTAVCKDCGAVFDMDQFKPEEEEIEKKEEKSFPSAIEQASNFTKSMYNFAASGFKVVDEDEYTHRRETCRKCDRYNHNSGRCMECGCLVAAKAKIATEECPLKLWIKQRNKES